MQNTNHHHQPKSYLPFLLWVFAAPLDGHQDMHVCKNSSLQTDSSHGLRQNTCMACCWKGKYRNPYSQQTQPDFRTAFTYSPRGSQVSSEAEDTFVSTTPTQKRVYYTMLVPSRCGSMHAQGHRGLAQHKLYHLTATPPVLDVYKGKMEVKVLRNSLVTVWLHAFAGG